MNRAGVGVNLDQWKKKGEGGLINACGAPSKRLQIGI